MAAVLVVIYLPNEPDDQNNGEGLTRDASIGSPSKSMPAMEVSEPASERLTEPGQGPGQGDNLPDTDQPLESDQQSSEKTKLLPAVDAGSSVTVDRDVGQPHPGFDPSESPAEGPPDVVRDRTGVARHQDEKADHSNAFTTETITLADRLQTVLESLDVANDVWTKSDDEVWWQVSFVVQVENCDAILRRLTICGIGNIQNTSVTIFPASFHQAPKPLPSIKGEDGASLEKRQSVVDVKSDFVKSIRSRLTVAQVVAGVEGNAKATFDFIMLIILASFIAGLGLVENSSVILVASMLISPLMGPILGGTFGFVIQNRDLTLLGVRNATIGLAICLVVGVLFGFIVAAVNSHGADWGSGDVWPTTEMQSRGMLRSLWVGILIAVPSGAGVALSVLGGNIGSLVGVAISASLLPPAVNAGMLWAYSIVTALTPPALLKTAADAAMVTVSSVINSMNESVTTDSVRNMSLLPSSPPEAPPVPPSCPALDNNNYKHIYTCTMANEAAILGAVSLFLTILNIFCIFIVGIGVLKIKEVAPHTTVSAADEMFWKRDLPVARHCYKTLKGKESLDMAKFAKETAKEWKEQQDKIKSKRVTGEDWSQLINGIGNYEAYQDVMTRMPTGAPRPPLLRSFSYHGQEAIKELTTGEEPGELRQRHTSGASGDSSSYATPVESMGSPGIYSPFGPQHGANQFTFHRWGTPPSTTPSTATPPTADERKFVFDQPTPPLRNHRRIPRHLHKQMSLTPSIEMKILKAQNERPKVMGKFTVSTVKEEDEKAALETEPRKTQPSSNSSNKKTVRLDAVAVDMEAN